MPDAPHILDHEAAALARLIEQCKGKPLLASLITIPAARIQALEDVFYDLLTKRLFAGEGAQLDNLGVIIGQPRGDAPDDASYLRLLRARVLANRSNGTVPEVLAVLRAALDGEGVRVYTQENVGIPPCFIVTITGIALNPGRPAGDDGWLATALLRLLGTSRMSGVRGVLEWQPEADADCFAFANCAMLTQAALDGDDHIFVDSINFPAGMPNFTSAGFASVDGGSALEIDSLVFVGPDWRINFTGGNLGGDHDAGEPVVPVDAFSTDNAPGQGFDTATTINDAVSASDTFINMQTSDGFPSSGTIVVDDGEATMETLAYTSITGAGPYQFNLAGAAAFDHEIGAPASLSVGPGGRLSGALDS